MSRRTRQRVVPVATPVGVLHYDLGCPPSARGPVPVDAALADPARRAAVVRLLAEILDQLPPDLE